ncbi:MAG: hypothetical protein WBL63_12760 [Candidatus Acidiferrum sp.]
MVAKGPGPRWYFGSLASIAGAAACLFFVSYLAAFPQSAPTKHEIGAPSGRPDIIFVQTPVIISGPLAQRFPKGGRIVRLSPLDAQGAPVHLTNGFFAAADPQINFEGTKVLFSGQKNQGERWQIWAMDLDGSNKRQVTQCAEDCLRGAYLPDNEIAFTVEETRGRNLQSQLAVVKMDGSEFRRITFGTAPFQLETVLLDGRIVASAPWPLSGAEEGNGSRLLYTLRPDGTALESFRCEHRQKAIQADVAELQDGSLIFVRKTRAAGSAGGELVRIQQGAPEGALFGTRQGVYQSPRQLSQNELLISKKEPSADSTGRFDLYSYYIRTGTVAERLFSDAQLSSIQAVPVAPHAVPKRYWNTLNPDSNTGNFISLNSYISSDDSRGLISTPIAQVRVFTMNSSDGKERSLGEAPVETDGSFFVQVPANWPIRFVLLDAKGQLIREERGWIWTRPGEQRGCTGCHGDKAIAPENHWPLTLRRFDTPTPLGEIDHGSTTTSQAK